jgi:hypothetical protein
MRRAGYSDGGNTYPNADPLEGSHPELALGAGRAVGFVRWLGGLFSNSSTPVYDVLMPGGSPVGFVARGATDDIRTVSLGEFNQIRDALIAQSKPATAPNGFRGDWFTNSQGSWGLRSSNSGPALQINMPGIPFTKIHQVP